MVPRVWPRAGRLLSPQVLCLLCFFCNPDFLSDKACLGHARPSFALSDFPRVLTRSPLPAPLLAMLLV